MEQQKSNFYKFLHKQENNVFLRCQANHDANLKVFIILITLKYLK
jgi:hypothetical protein